MTEYPTPEQVEAAAEIIWRCGRWLRQPWEQVPEPEKHRQRAVAQAALVAAAGVAPQASSDHAALASEVLKLAIKRRSKGDQYARYPEYVCFSDRYYAEAEVMRQASVALAAPVQVDEAKLAVDVPPIPFGPKGVPYDKANAGYYRSAAKNIRYHARRGRSVMGSNLTEAVARLCDATADALYERHRLRGGAQ